MLEKNEELEMFEIIDSSDLSTLSTLFASGCHGGMSNGFKGGYY